MTPIFILFSDTVCPHHLADLLIQHFVYLFNYHRDSARFEDHMTYREFIFMVGKLYSAVNAGLAQRNFRIRLHANNYSESPQQGCWMLRLFGCLSFEEDTLGAQLNRRDRYQNFRALWTQVNSHVSTKIYSIKNCKLSYFRSLYSF